MAAAKSTYAFKEKKPGKTKAFFICLLIALFLWMVHSLNRVYPYTFTIPVEFRNVPINKRPVIALPESISVEVKASGLKLALIQLNESKENFVIDFNKLKTVSRDQNFVLSSSGLKWNRRFKFETQIKTIHPDTLYFSEKTGFQKIVPVKVPLFVKCKEGYGYKRPILQPAYVTIWGDTASIEKTDTLYTQPLSVNNLSSNLSTQLEILKPSASVNSTVNDISVTLEVARLIQETVNVPVLSLKQDPSQQVRMFPTRVKVTFTSLQNSFNPADSVLFNALVNTEKANPATGKCKVFLSNQPAQVTVLSIEPAEVQILILRNP